MALPLAPLEVSKRLEYVVTEPPFLAVTKLLEYVVTEVPLLTVTKRLEYVVLEAAEPNLFLGDLQIEGIAPAPPHELSLRWSDTRGASWSSPVVQTMGNTGQLTSDILFRRLGMSRDRVFEVFWSTNSPTALSGAFVDYTVEGQSQ